MSEPASELSEYVVDIGGIEHTLLLDEEGAKRYGDAAKPVGAAKATRPATKAKTPANK